MTPDPLLDRLHERIEQALEILAHASFGNFDVRVPELSEGDAFVELFIGLDLLIEDLRASREELQGEVRERTRELEEDIRQREKVEAQLRASEAQYRLLVETSPVPIMLCDLDGRIRTANPALQHAFRLGNNTASLGARWLDLVAPEDRERAARVTADGNSDSKQCEVEVRFRRSDGGEFVGQLRCSAVRDAAGACSGVLMVINDLTLHRQRERELLRSEQIDSLGTLAGGIAHDFNNYLTAIVGCLSVAKGLVQHQPEVTSLLDDGAEAAFRATSLTRQLLTFSKGGLPVKACVQIGELIRRVSEFCVRGSNVKCDVRIEDGLWPVEVDSGQFEQVLGNLVINATQAMPRGGTIVVSAENAVMCPPESQEAQLFVRISVEDRGVGIPAENLRRIYDPYFSTKEGGSGLGLATAYSVVKKHNGFIDCASAVGAGSTFTIHLPASSRSPEAPAPSAHASNPGQGRILVMDDDEQVRKVVVRQLQEVGYEVFAVASGAAAVDAYREALSEGHRFDVALMDLTVPGGDGGKEVMPKLLALDPMAKGIVISGYSDDPVLAEFKKHGFAAQLAKPYRMDDLLAAIATATTQPR